MGTSGRRFRPSRRFRKYAERRPRMKLSRDELLKYLRERGIRTKGDLEKKRKDDEPNRYDFLKVFGKWSDAVLMAFGPPIAEIDRKYVLKCVNHLNAWNVREFRDIRRRMPDIVPSWGVVVRLFGSYRNLFAEARKENLEATLFEYQKLVRRIGRTPTVSEIRAANLNIDRLIEFYEGKRGADSFVMGLKRSKL